MHACNNPCLVFLSSKRNLQILVLHINYWRSLIWCPANMSSSVSLHLSMFNWNKRKKYVDLFSTVQLVYFFLFSFWYIFCNKNSCSVLLVLLWYVKLFSEVKNVYLLTLCCKLFVIYFLGIRFLWNWLAKPFLVSVNNWFV